jgi:hypothetical protein
VSDRKIDRTMDYAEQAKEFANELVDGPDELTVKGGVR